VIDTAVKHSGLASLRITSPSTNPNGYKARVFQLFPTVPFRAYRLSVWIKTASFTGPGNIGMSVLGANGRTLYQNRDYRLGAAPPAGTQDWTQYAIDFNSLENTSVNIYLTATGNATGKVWFDDAALDEVGLYSTVRRASLPVVVQSYEKLKTFREGSDYTVGAERLTLPAGSTISSGSILKVSWYQLADCYELWSVPSSATQPEYFTVLDTNARLINSRIAPSSWLMRYDEWRVSNWDPSAGNISAGQYVADAMRKSEDILRAINPAIERLVWGDMFDPYHNAVSRYYGVNGSLNGAWDGVSPDTIILNWYNAGTTANLKFWAGLDPLYPKGPHRQIIAGYYEGLANVETWLRLLAQAETEGVDDVIGFMYTTWATGNDGGIGRYDDLEAVADLCRKAGRWE